MQASAQKFWGTVQGSIQSLVSPEQYKLWFTNIRPKTFDRDCLTLEVQDSFCEVWLEKNYLDLIREKAILASGRQIKVRLEVGNSPQANISENAMRSVTPKTEPEVFERVSLGTPRDLQQFNPRNTFETFVVGANNQFAHGASMAVAQAPGKSYNPLFLYGGVGLGKTHLLHAIGQHVVGHRKNARVAYVSSERFTNEFIDAIQNNNLMRFRKRYRQTDVLLIDDIQFLSGKERIQEEFFHTFNALHEAHKQIVLTCDRPPNEIQGLEQRLVSRFEWGLSTDLQPPDVETRVAILRKKEKSIGVKLPDEVINFIAERIRTNIRRLEGALTRVAGYVALTSGAVSIDSVETLLRELLQEEGRHTISIEIIQKKVAEHFDIRIADMTSRRRPENIAFPRQVAMYLARTLTDSSLNVIGEAFGGRDHGTVLHGFRLVKGRMEIDGNVRQTVSFLEKQLMR
jgi:chromosomal replication initiator protein